LTFSARAKPPVRRIARPKAMRPTVQFFIVLRIEELLPGSGKGISPEADCLDAGSVFFRESP
jgi:hypothetical protein